MDEKKKDAPAGPSNSSAPDAPAAPLSVADELRKFDSKSGGRRKNIRNALNKIKKIDQDHRDDAWHQVYTQLEEDLRVVTELRKDYKQYNNSPSLLSRFKAYFHDATWSPL